MKLVTHNGTFHADEVFATVILRHLHQGVEVLRTRDLSKINNDDIVYDVGLEYDGVYKFDHHQNDNSLQRSNGIPYSSFGLIWKHFGYEYIESMSKETLSPGALEFIWNKFDESIVQSIDADDNGFFSMMPRTYPNFGVSEVISNFNTNETNSKVQTYAFFSAVELAQTIVNKHLKVIMERANDFYKVSNLITESETLVLKEYLRWGESIKNTHIKYVIFPTSDGYRVRSVQPEYNFNAEEVNTLSSNKDYIFCHKSGFLAGAKSIELCEEIIQKFGR